MNTARNTYRNKETLDHMPEQPARAPKPTYRTTGTDAELSNRRKKKIETKKPESHKAPTKTTSRERAQVDTGVPDAEWSSSRRDYCRNPTKRAASHNSAAASRDGLRLFHLTMRWESGG